MWSKKYVAFEPTAKEDFRVQLVDKYNPEGIITYANKMQLQQAINKKPPKQHGSPSIFHLKGEAIFRFKGEGIFTVDCEDLNSMQWLYDILPTFNNIWNADLHLVQRRSILYLRKITFKLNQQNFVSSGKVLGRIQKYHVTLFTGLWKPYPIHFDGHTPSVGIDEDSVRETEAPGSRTKYYEDVLDGEIKPRDNRLPRQSFIKDSQLCTGTGCNDSSGSDLSNDKN